MLVLKPSVATNNGIKLQILNMQGERIEFTKLSLGSGIYSDDEMTKENLMKRTSLKSEKQQFGISSMKMSDDGTTMIFSVMITNENLESGYTIREVGLFARIKDRPETECLASISLAEIEDDFPSYDGKTPSRILMKYHFTVSNSDTVNLTYEHEPVALVEYVNSKDKELQEQIDKINSALNGLSFGVSDDGCLTISYDDGTEEV